MRIKGPIMNNRAKTLRFHSVGNGESVSIFEKQSNMVQFCFRKMSPAGE